ncbi:MAG: insulinase family protein [Anaerolineae bacterium]|nr:insulinase family protein [Anaerolineae bacterium]
MTLMWRPMDTSPFVEQILPNGLRAVAIGRPGTSTVASKVFLKAGSRHDGDRHGIGHCLEHALFRSTTTRSSRELFGEIEDLGGRISQTKERKKTMATEKEMYELLGRAMVDAEFRGALIADPAKAAEGLGISLTDEQRAGLKASDLATAEGLDDRLSKMARGGT